MVVGRRALLALGTVVVLVACSSDDDDAGGTTVPALTVSSVPASVVSTPSSASDGSAPVDTVTDTYEPAEPVRGPAAITGADVDAALAAVDGIVEDEMAATGIPGVAVAIVFDDEVVHAEGYGVREVGGDDRVDTDTVFQLASLSKPITSTGLAALVSKGVIDWDEPVHGAAPDLVFSDPWVTDHITFADLYSHRSGLPGGIGDALEIMGYSRDEVLERLRFVPLDPFRATYAYTNFGMTAGGQAAAEAAGVSFEDLMDRQLFEPAGMTSASARYDDFLARPNRATLHPRIAGEWVVLDERDPDAQAPAGGVSANVLDVATWVRLQLGAGTLDGTEIVAEDALSATHSPHVTRGAAGYDGQPSSYGLGWGIGTDHLGLLRWSHSGAFSTGASTTAVLLPSEGLGVVVLTNGMPIGAPEIIADEVIDTIATGAPTRDWSAFWYGDIFSNLFVEDPALSDVPSPPTSARDDDAYVGSYANDFYGTFEVVVDGEDLTLVESGPNQLRFPLTHWDADTFTYLPDGELPDIRQRVAFTAGDDGRASSVTVADLDLAGLGTLTRVS